MRPADVARQLSAPLREEIFQLLEPDPVLPMEILQVFGRHKSPQTAPCYENKK